MFGNNVPITSILGIELPYIVGGKRLKNRLLPHNLLRVQLFQGEGQKERFYK